MDSGRPAAVSDKHSAPTQDHFAGLTDPRSRELTAPLVNILTIALWALIAGGDDLVTIAASSKTWGGQDCRACARSRRPAEGPERVGWGPITPFKPDPSDLSVGRAIAPRRAGFTRRRPIAIGRAASDPPTRPPNTGRASPVSLGGDAPQRVADSEPACRSGTGRR